MQKTCKQKSEEKRQFTRLPYVLPVEFYLVSPETKEYLSELMQGFTKNVSRGGLCLEINNLKDHLLLDGLSGKSELLLCINLPFSRQPVKIFGRIVWFKKLNLYPHSYLLGISYLNPALPEAIKPVKFAKSMKWIKKVIAASVILLFAGFAGMSFSNVILRKTHKELVDKLVQISEKRSKVSQEIFYLEDLKQVLEEKSEDTKLQMFKLIQKEHKNSEDEKNLKNAQKDLSDIKKKIEVITEGEILLKKNLAAIKKEGTGLEEKSIKKMYNWLKIRQDKNTGLVPSYEGDQFLEDWAFIYDQALIAHCFLLFNDSKLAGKVLDFFQNQAKKVNGGFVNAYDVTNGHIVEYAVHSGPNIWLGLSALQHISITGQKKYLPFAEEIADWLIALQNEDAQGAIKGGPKISWVSTEHNLDAYAFFNNLYKITKNKKYLEAAEKTLSWLKQKAYMKAERRLKRGRGDATIATDTLAWAIAALGPAELVASEMDPDGILEFAEENCKVTVDYCLPCGSKGKITGFDFAKARNIGRGGVVSSEWTSQMIIALEIMSDFYRCKHNLKKAKEYRDKAEFYLTELDKLTINSASRTGQGAICFPYASHQNVDTGHGWRTPSGRKTGCVAGTVYAIFAKKYYNPFELK